LTGDNAEDAEVQFEAIFDGTDFVHQGKKLGYNELQKLCMKRGIKAKRSKEVLIKELRAYTSNTDPDQAQDLLRGHPQATQDCLSPSESATLQTQRAEDGKKQGASGLY
jgi:hypothetical protein